MKMKFNISDATVRDIRMDKDNLLKILQFMH
mgnify:FL=1